MTFGVVILAHRDLHRVAELVSFLCDQNVPVALHIDRTTDVPMHLQQAFETLDGLTLLPRRRCRWGGWSLVEATFDGTRHLLDRHKHVDHVALLSGSCVPVRPIEDLRAFLRAKPNHDFIQSVRADAADWVVDGLQEERFHYRFPVSFRSQRRLFDLLTRIQKRLPRAWARRVPAGLSPCLGSQWWCLSRRTLRAIQSDPQLPEYKRYFRGTWVPDESFFQTLARKHSRQIEARSLTWSPFDRTGRPVTLYNDHLMALHRIEPELFFARKIWPGADAIYDHCLSGARSSRHSDGQALSRIAERARSPKAPICPGVPARKTSPGEGPYLVLYGVDMLFPGLGHAIEKFELGPWLGPQFEKRRGPAIRTAGGLSASVAIARVNPAAYLSNLLRGQTGRPVLVLRPGAPHEAMSAIAQDPNAHVIAVSGAWTIPLHRDPARSEPAFATNQRAEIGLLAAIRTDQCRAKIHHWSLDAALGDPDAVLMQIGLPAGALACADVGHLPAYVTQMRDAGLNPAMAVRADVSDRGGHRTDLAAE